MPKLPILSGLEILKALKKHGFELSHRSGRHITVKKKVNGTLIVVMPLQKEIAIGVLLSIIRQSGMNKEQFLEMFKK